ncbi:4-(cytidine 5'-diphospho)-2-C-methyl-D-erythritol kinase [Asticcacaulis taihuensis]|uniref:4-diphosphocytidyl-2-C-methyl-D-erythritol kinase n=1 Tax=Asticcacaulis taihuensis TaxID=260084 RepID=A0A1G4S4R4_9CAUL|nr:4-(cytidine 5'-diphospho)-2-C-methyl-D-erythritol kinase [Asticcacaulis taihuensis]SCW64016.1 4-diphosphocytidyl-2-C-methyl-D-erythritol kinase [Asticcacaulis taihuensis]
MLAAAKVNLYLHVAAPDARGYHPLQSLVAFADIGDEVTFSPLQSAGSSKNLISCLSIEGPFAEGLQADESNLILKAVRRFEAAAGVRVDRHTIRLTKNLPVASGIGGGSADAGATLRLLRELYAPNMPDSDLAAIAGAIGADGIMCLWSQSAFAEGYGERLTPVTLPEVPAVLVNPGVECATARVYGGYDAVGRFNEIEAMSGFLDVSDIRQLISALSHTRNDLQSPAIHLQPVIAEVLTALEAQKETLFARMSGSGATCFALCETDEAASALSGRMQAMMPAAWVRACRLG